LNYVYLAVPVSVVVALLGLIGYDIRRRRQH
jgi:hypothetical protein